MVLSPEGGLAVLGEEPGEEFGGADGGVPGVVSAVRDFGVAEGAWVEGADGGGDVAGAGGRDDGVAVAVEGPDGDVGERGGLREVGAAADGDSCGEAFGLAREGVPGAVAAHGDAHDVDACGVDGVVEEEVVEEFEDVCEGVRGLW